MAQTQDAVYFTGEQEMIDYTPGADVDAGELVFFGSGQEVLVGVALVPIPANKQGALAITGQYWIKKKATKTFSIGDLVGWDTTPGEAVDTGDAGLNKELGVCVRDAGASDDAVLTKVNFGRGWESSGA